MGSQEIVRPDVVTFDCYGTLIDWETGIRNAFHRALAKSSTRNVGEDQIFELYEEEEKRVEKEKPFHSYRQVLSKTVLRVAERAEWQLTEQESRFLAQDLPNWKPFPETNPALQRLGKKYMLGILSNVDDDLLAGTRKKFSANFEIIVTAEQVRSYKPDPAHFEKARRLVGKDRKWLHVASSMYHDINPARIQGIPAVWVNRRNIAAGQGAERGNVMQVRGLSELADWLEA